MDDMTTIHAHADTLARTREQLAQAHQARRDEIDGDRSLFSRMIDAVSMTPTEKAVEEMEKRQAKVQAEAMAATRAWIDEDVARQLEGGGLAAQRVKRFQNIFDHANGRDQVFQGLRQQGHQTLHGLNEAIQVCKEAENMEFADALGSSRFLAVMSSYKTKGAAEAIKSANSQVKAFGNALKSSNLNDHNIKAGPSDKTDLIVDLVIDLPIDVFSWMNMCALGESVASCQQAFAKVAPIVERVDGVAMKTGQRRSSALSDLNEARAPFVEKAIENLPPALQTLVLEQQATLRGPRASM